MPAARVHTGSFLGRYTDALSLRVRPWFGLTSARRQGDGAPCVVLHAGAQAKAAPATHALTELSACHAAVSHPRLARVSPVMHHEGTPFVEVDFPAVCDGHDLIEILNARNIKQPYGPADSFIASLRAALAAASATPDPRGAPALCTGRLGLSNTLFSAEGDWCLLGIGRNVLVEKDDGSLDTAVSFFQAPEVATGQAPSPKGDYVALLLLMRSLLPWVDMAPQVARILRGEIEPGDMELIQCLQWTEQHMVGCLPSQRASLEEAIDVAAKIRQLLGSRIDEPAYGMFLRDLLASAEDGSPLPSGESAAQTLTLGAGAMWMAAPDGTRHRLGRAHRRIMLALAQHHEQRRGTVLTANDLLDAGWPGEAAVGDSGQNRVYVSLNRLRNMGLRSVVEHEGDGYRLVPDTAIRWAEA
jgi:hypothetical protein